MSPYPTVEMVVKVKYNAVRYREKGAKSSNSFYVIHPSSFRFLPMKIQMHPNICDNPNSTATKKLSLSNDSLNYIDAPIFLTTLPLFFISFRSRINLVILINL